MDHNIFEEKTYKRIKLLVAIVNRDYGEAVSEICAQHGAKFNLTFMGRGTAKSDILDYLGLTDTKKDIILAAVLETRAAELLQALKKVLHLDEPGNGIAFTLSITSVGGPLTHKYMSGFGNFFAELAKKRSEKIEQASQP